jgi:PAS domain S-box-containing protein
MQRSAISSPPSPTQRSLADILHTGAAAWIILGISLAITVVAWQLSASFAEQRAEERFRFQVEDAQIAIHKRLSDYEQALRGGIGLFQASQRVDRPEWRAYVSALQIDKHYPGIQGIGFSKWILPKDREAHVREIRAEGFPDYSMRPPGERAEYSAIIYLEPFDWRNMRAFGFDMYSEPTRRAAMSRARDTGETAMSGKVTLVQETKKDMQHGFLMYLPLYKKGAPAATVEERRAALEGFVYSPFRMGDLMQGTLGQALREIDFEIFDGADVSENNLLYASGGKMLAGDGSHRPTFAASKPLEFGGHTWTIYYDTNPAFDAATRSSQPLVVAFGGVVIDLLLFYIILSLARRRQQALALAAERQDKLLEQEGQFKAITDSAHEGIVSMDAGGRMTYVNGAMERVFGHDRDVLVGQRLVDLLAPADQARVSDALASEAGSDEPLEVVALRAGGDEFPLEISLSKWSVAGQTHASAVVRDQTERKRVERMKGEFISTVSHELRTPLTSIRGSLGLMSGALGSALDENTRRLADIANQNAERLVRLINDILDVDRLDSGEMRFDMRAHSVPALVRQALEANSAIASHAGVALELTECAEATASVDTDRFQQVMTNLLANAIKFSPPGQRVSAAVTRAGDKVRVAVSDHGPGIPEEFRTRIFQKFAQADSSDARTKGGTGLGLSIVKAIVERFGGQVGYTSDAATGTTIYFDLPLAESAQHAA